MHYHEKGDLVLANCGDEVNPDWIPGIVVEVYGCAARRPYRVTLERESDGRITWYFPFSYVIRDNKRNRKNKGLEGAK